MTSPAALAWYASQKRWQPAPHLNLLNRKLIDVAMGRCRRLLLCMPPRHGKSMMTSQYFPAWFLGTFPDKRVILASYEADFAASWGRKARDVIEQCGRDVFGVKVRSDSKAANRWNLADHPGGMDTAGVGGPITGKGADLLIVDDPIKNAEEGMSKTHKDKAWNWWVSTAYTRLEPGSSAVVIMTRWAVDDLAGRLIAHAKDGGEKWEIFNLPALAEEDDALGRKEGEALWPARFNVESLSAIRRAQGEFWFGAMYQQRPILPEGNLFKRSWFRYFLDDGSGRLRLDSGDVLEAWQQWRFIVVDPAASEKQTSDFTAIGIFAVLPGNLLAIVDMVRERIPLEGIPPRLKLLCDRYKPQFVSMEANGFQVAIARAARRIEGMPAVREVEPQGKGKLVRATPAIIRAESGQIFLPRQAPWVPAFLDECLQFTGLDDPHDDQVDVLAYAAIEMNQRALYPRRPDETDGKRTIEDRYNAPDDSAQSRRGMFGKGGRVS